jgi:hypothetical protein
LQERALPRSYVFRIALYARSYVPKPTPYPVVLSLYALS